MQILAAGQLISVVAKNEDIRKGKEIFYAFRDGILYDPRYDFKPAKAGAHRPKQNTIDEYHNLLSEAKQCYMLLHTEYKNAGQAGEVKEVIKEVIVEVPNGSNDALNQRILELQAENERLRTAAPVKSGESKPASMLESLITQSVAQIAAKDVIEMTLPMLDKHIKEQYGVLPQVHEIRTADKVTQITGVLHEKFEIVMQMVLNDIRFS
jgi:hypothetical protein